MSVKSTIEVKGVVKKFDDKVIVNGISLEIFKGECFGILGPNGAGKSTTMKMMYCSSQVTEGELYILGLNVKNNHKEIKSKIGIVPQDDGLEADFSCYENLRIFSRYYGIDDVTADRRITELLQAFRLDEYRDRNVETLSGGMKRRLAIARGLIHRPEVLFLDEPTTGLDPQARYWMWEYFKKLKEDLSTVVITTHYMEEAEFLCDRLAIIDHGKILAVGTPMDLINVYIGKEVVEVEVSENDVNYYANRLKQNQYRFQTLKNKISIYLQPDQESRKVLDIINGDKIIIRKPTLNDVFLRISGHDLRDESL